MDTKREKEQFLQQAEEFKSRLDQVEVLQQIMNVKSQFFFSVIAENVPRVETDLFCLQNII